MNPPTHKNKFSSVHTCIGLLTWCVANTLIYVYQFLCSHNCETRTFSSQNMPETVNLSPRRLSVDRRWNYWFMSQSTQVLDICPSTDAESIWLESQLPVLRPTQKLLTHILSICPLTITTTNDSLPRHLSSDHYRN